MIEESLGSLISELIKQVTLPIYGGLKNLTKEANNKIKVTLGSCFSEYLVRNYERYSKTKTLLYREMPVNLKDFYVRTDLIINSEYLDEIKFISEIEKNKRLIVLGGAGCGKSTFCKSLFVELIEKPIGIFPIFIELRHLNSFSENSLYDFILKSMININSSFNKEQLEYSLKLGKVLFILDGFDEINNEERETVEREILNLSNNYHGIRILISSRFDNRFSSWEEFYQYTIQGLDKNKALTLINKLNYDRQVKKFFLKELDDKLYESHASFASNPLLLTMMLLTYEQIAEIPNKLHLFYEQAFLTLFNKHDSLKSMYKRKSYSQLPLDDFKRCLEAFCILSYCDRLYSFNENQMFKYLDNAIRLSNVKSNSENLLNDLLNSVCMLQRDGLEFSFTHRSFQEYFSAQFLVNSSLPDKNRLFDRIFSFNAQDNVINMIYDINPEFLEREWIIPKAEKIVSDVDDLKCDFFLILNKMFTFLTIMDDGDDLTIGYGLGDSLENYGDFCLFMKRLYRRDYEFFFKDEDNNKGFKDINAKLIDYMEINGDIVFNEMLLIDFCVQELIEGSGVPDFTFKLIDFLRLFIKERKVKYNTQDSDIMSLIFGK